jgi:SAM-dependent methyltransferase
MIDFTGERIVPGAENCEPTFARKMYQEHIARYEFAAAFVAKADVLDVGCGVGYGSHHLASKGARSVTAFDISADAVAHARRKYAHPAIHYKEMAAADLDARDAFDVVTCFELIEHIEDQNKVLDNIKRALRPDGVLLISTPRPHDAKRSEFHVGELHLDEFKALLLSRFDTVFAFFESNYYTSFIGDHEPKRIDNIVRLTDRFRVDSADYYILLATNGNADRLRSAIKPVLAMEDDDYVQNLEKDVTILHAAEDNAKQRIADLEVGERVLQTKLAEAVRNEQDEVLALKLKLASTAAALTAAETEVFQRRDELVTLALIVERLDRVASEARNALQRRNEALAAMESRAISAESSHAHELGQAQMLHRVLKEHSDALIETTERAERAEASHLHELGQAQMLHRVLKEHSDALIEMTERAERAQAAHQHELGQAQMLHRVLKEHSDALIAAKARLHDAEAELEEVPRLTAALQTASDRASAAEQRVIEQDILIAELRSEVAKAEELGRVERSQAERLISELRRTIEAMRNSFEWRLGARLRRIVKQPNIPDGGGL